MTDSRIPAQGIYNVETGDAAAERAKEVGGNSTDFRGHVRYLDFLAAILAEDRYHVAELHAGDVGNVERGQIHGDRADKRDALTTDESLTLVGEGANDAVCVASVNHGDSRGPLGDETRSVAHGLARRQVAQRDNAGAESETRLERHDVP